MGIIIGAVVGGMCFVIFGLMRAVSAGGSSIIVIISKLKGSPVEQSLFVRIMVGAGIILSIVFGIAVSVVLGGVVGGVLEYVLMKLA